MSTTDTLRALDRRAAGGDTDSAQRAAELRRQQGELPPRQIVVLQRGWVVVGRVARSWERPEELSITDCAVVRQWGTTRGLGQLAEDGPLAGTVLDACPDVTAHILTVVLQMGCSSAWPDKL